MVQRKLRSTHTLFSNLTIWSGGLSYIASEFLLTRTVHAKAACSHHKAEKE